MGGRSGDGVLSVARWVRARAGGASALAAPHVAVLACIPVCAQRGVWRRAASRAPEKREGKSSKSVWGLARKKRNTKTDDATPVPGSHFINTK